MKNLTVKAMDTVLYAACGGLFLWMAWDREIGFYTLIGASLLVLAAWEGWAWVRDYRAGRNEKREWDPSMTVAFILVAVVQVRKAITEPYGINPLIAAGWVFISAVYTVRTVRGLRAENEN